MGPHTPSCKSGQATITLVCEAVGALNKAWAFPELTNPDRQTPIYATGSPIDSLKLVLLIATIEDQVAERYGVEVVLADERAMSQKRSPFATIASLAEYLSQLIAESAAERVR